MLSRRTLLATSAASPLLLSTSAFAETPKDVIVVGMAIDDIVSLDPAEAFEFSGGEVNGNTYQRLVIPDPADPSKIKGELAERWEVAPDGVTYTFIMKKGPVFASGKPITAQDAAFSLQRAVKLNKSPAFIINQFGFTKDNVDSKIVATDDHTLVLTIAEKQSPSFLFYCLSANVGSVVEKAVVTANAKGDDLGNEWLKTNSAGSGPYILRSWKGSESVIMDANPHSAVTAKTKRIIFKHIPDPSAQVLQLEKGDIDIARGLQPEQLKAAEKNPKLRLSASPRSYISYIAMNQKVEALTKPQVRQAIKWAIDYDGIQQNIVPTTYSVQQGFIPQGFLGAISDRPFKMDVAKAKALLAEAGYPNGFEITLDHTSVAPQPDIAQAIQANLAAIGIKVTLLAGENRQVITKTRARGHQLALLAWGSDYFDPNSNAETFCINTDNSDAARNKTLAWRSSWQDQDLTDRAIAALKETDTKKRQAMYEQMQRDYQQRSPFAMLLQAQDKAVMRVEVKGFALPPLGARTVYEKATKA
jgi:peptide/nickel transport system substrate-binding protein